MLILPCTQVEYEWDENKNVANIAKHDLAFEEAALIFGEPHIVIDSKYEAEPRYLAIDPLKGRMITVVFTVRGDGVVRLISARSARHEEKRKYRSLYAG